MEAVIRLLSAKFGVPTPSHKAYKWFGQVKPESLDHPVRCEITAQEFEGYVCVSRYVPETCGYGEWYSFEPEEGLKKLIAPVQ